MLYGVPEARPKQMSRSLWLPRVRTLQAKIHIAFQHKYLDLILLVSH